LPLGLAAFRRVGLKLGTENSAAIFDEVQSGEQCGLVTLTSPGLRFEVTQRRVEADRPVQLHTRAERRNPPSIRKTGVAHLTGIDAEAHRGSLLSRPGGPGGRCRAG